MRHCLPVVATVLAALILTATVAGGPPATVVKQADSLIDARGMTLSLTAPYGIMINGGVSANDVIVSANGFQYSAYYVKDTTSGTAYYVAAARRRSPTPDTPGGPWEVANLTTSAFTNGLSGGVPWNSHCAVALGIDLDNQKLHLAWDMHNKTLRYRASAAGIATGTPGTWSASVFGTETSKMGGQTISGVTYPNFVRDAAGSLGFFYRYGTSSSGYWQTRDYDGTTSTPSWSSAFVYDSGTGADAATGSTARTAYPNGFSIDRTNRYHMTFVWREDVNGGGDGTNHDLCYAFSDDKGLTWRNNAGVVIASQAAGTRISIASPGLVVRPIPQGNGLMNTQGQDVDASGRVHALMYYRDTAKSATAVSTFTPSVSSYFNLWRDTLGTWHRNRVPFDCTGSRPRLYFDARDNAVAVLADGSLRVFAATKASNWTDWTLVASEVNYLSDPVADRDLFRTTGVLSVFEQRPPAANLAASEVRSLDLIPTFAPPTAIRFAAADDTWSPASWTGGTAPGAESFAFIDAGRRATLSSASGAIAIHSLGLGTAAGAGSVAITGGTLQVAHSLVVGREAGSRGDYRQSGGSVRCDRFVVGEFTTEASGGGASAATVSGGSLVIGELSVAVAAGGSSSGSSFTVIDGTVAIGGEVVLGDCGNAATLDIRGGMVTVAGDIAPGVNGSNTATLRLTGGDFDATGNSIRVARLTLGSGTVRNAPAISTTHLAVEGSLPAAATMGAMLVSAATGDTATRISAARRPALTVRRGGSVAFSALQAATLPLASLAIETGTGGGRIDLAAGRLEIAANGITEVGLRSAILAGRNGGAWNGATGILTSLGDDAHGVGFSILGDGSAVVAWAAYGDATLDRLVDVLDAAAVLSAARYDQGGGASWSQGDMNYDGMVDVLDMADMLGTGLFDAGWYATPVAVPEPTTEAWLLGGLLACGAAAVKARRHPRRARRHPPRNRRHGTGLMRTGLMRTGAAGACAVVVAAMLAAAPQPAAAQTGSYDWTAATPLYGGVTRAFVQLTGTAPLKVNCLRIDTLAPGISFATTPRAVPWISGSAETIRQTTSNFILSSQTTATKVVAAVNGDLFNIALSP
ncbi:MAG: BNR-4 repeat-containing protein, partial [Planctomycetaceae bacterium]